LARSFNLPARVTLDEGAWSAATRAVFSRDDNAAVSASLGALLSRLAALGIVREEAVSNALRGPARPIERLWSAIAPRLERLALSTKLDDLGRAAGLSSSQVNRETQRLLAVFGLVGPGLRSLLHRARLKAAIVFLSGEGVSVNEVAEIAGYGSTDAMARAFHNAGLPSPSAVQRQMLETLWE
jgi:AraC-like DNA-binding protein